MMSIGILQPLYPHYRKEFFQKLIEETGLKLYYYHNQETTKKKGFLSSKIPSTYIPSIQCKGFLLYNPFTLIRKHHILILPFHFAHISTWIILLLKNLLNIKIILWGHGISVKRYLIEEVTPDWKLRLMLNLADGAWLYMEKEKQQWQQIFPKKPITALRNTISGIEKILDSATKQSDKEILKQKYRIKQDIILIFCARCESKFRRLDLLIEVIENLKPETYGFIIIGEGKYKPDFTHYHNVYDFGDTYDRKIKQELFTISDIYFQPGWLGLSIVEAMAYSLPVFTFKRSKNILQCVEYNYLIHMYNGMIFENVTDLLDYMDKTNKKAYANMGINAHRTAEKLTIKQMTEKAIIHIKSMF